MSFLPLSCEGNDYRHGTPAIGTECIGALDSYTFVKGIYGGYFSRGHQIIHCTMYTSISNILVPLSTPVQDVYAKTVFIKN